MIRRLIFSVRMARSIPWKVVSGTGVAAGVGDTAKTDAHLVLEHKMSHAILKAHSEGVSDPEEIKRRMLAAREDHLNNG
jgi:histidine ammonia-lyase